MPITLKSPAGIPFTRIAFCHSPTPLEALPRLSDVLGCELWIKRDDCTGLAGGGNKTRKLEYLLADAQRQGADTLITIGGLQSNHARQTAAAAARLGFECDLILETVDGTPEQDYSDNGNILLDKLLDARLHYLPDDQSSQHYAEHLISTLTQAGKTPYLIPVGGSNPIGALGYAHCARELIQQFTEQNIIPDRIVLATGSAGTQAGLLAGLILEQSDIPVLGINVSRDTDAQAEQVTALLEDTLQYLGLPPELAEGRVHTDGRYYGAGYGIITEAAKEAIHLCARQEGILLDPVYTGKGMAGLIDYCRSGLFAANEKILFLHTGGSQGLFAYKSEFETP